MTDCGGRGREGLWRRDAHVKVDAGVPHTSTYLFYGILWRRDVGVPHTSIYLFYGILWRRDVGVPHTYLKSLIPDIVIVSIICVPFRPFGSSSVVSGIRTRQTASSFAPAVCVCVCA